MIHERLRHVLRRVQKRLLLLRLHLLRLHLPLPLLLIAPALRKAKLHHVHSAAPKRLRSLVV